MKCMLGGDFNTEQNRGWIGNKLEELLCEFGLEVCKNPSVLLFDNLWTFRSCLGHKNVLDYGIVTQRSEVVSSKAINDFKLRSDHRVVQVCIVLPPERRP